MSTRKLTSNFTVIGNDCLRNKTLSLKAKGLYTLMVSLPDDWVFSVRGLVSICKESEKAISSALRELKTAGYIAVEKHYPTDRSDRIFYSYTIFNTPQDPHFVPLQDVGLHDVGLHDVGLQKVTQINTKEQNKEILNTEVLTTDYQRADVADEIRSADDGWDEVSEYEFENIGTLNPDESEVKGTAIPIDVTSPDIGTAVPEAVMSPDIGTVMPERHVTARAKTEHLCFARHRGAGQPL